MRAHLTIWLIKWTPFRVSLRRYLCLAANPAETSSGVEYGSLPSDSFLSLQAPHQTSLLTHTTIERLPHGPPTAHSFALRSIHPTLRASVHTYYSHLCNTSKSPTPPLYPLSSLPRFTPQACTLTS